MDHLYCPIYHHFSFYWSLTLWHLTDWIWTELKLICMLFICNWVVARVKNMNIIIVNFFFRFHRRKQWINPKIPEATVLKSGNGETFLNPRVSVSAPGVKRHLHHSLLRSTIHRRDPSQTQRLRGEHYCRHNSICNVFSLRYVNPKGGTENFVHLFQLRYGAICTRFGIVHKILRN